MQWPVWPVTHLPGLTPDTLGSYLASIGLLSLASSRWPDVRACWRHGGFLLVNGPADLTSLISWLADVAEHRVWSNYARSWYKTQLADTNKKTAASTGQWRSQTATEQELGLFHAHLALGERLSFNPLFGNGGSTGNRDSAVGWSAAVATLANPKRKWTTQSLTEDLEYFLSGKACRCLGDYNAGSWFSSANKVYNSGTKKPFRKGQVTPWAMVLACEAFPLFQGTSSRRLGAHRRSRAHSRS